MSAEHRDPRLEIPELLRQPVVKPASMEPGPKKPSDMLEVAKAWAVALDFVIMVIVGGGLGWGFDTWQQTAPTGTMIGLAIGFVVAFIRIVRATQKQERIDAERKAKARAVQSPDR